MTVSSRAHECHLAFPRACIYSPEFSRSNCKNLGTSRKPKNFIVITREPYQGVGVGGGGHDMGEPLRLGQIGKMASDWWSRNKNDFFSPVP